MVVEKFKHVHKPMTEVIKRLDRLEERLNLVHRLFAAAAFAADCGASSGAKDG
jgi:hypothetical protein